MILSLPKPLRNSHSAFSGNASGSDTLSDCPEQAIKKMIKGMFFMSADRDANLREGGEDEKLRK